MYDSMVKYVIILLVIFLIKCTSYDTRNPIELVSPINLGKVKGGVVKEFTVKCKNNSHKDIRLKEVHMSCNCIQQIKSNSNVVYAHDSTLFHFLFNPDGIGYVERRLSFYFDTLDEPYIFKITAYISRNI